MARSGVSGRPVGAKTRNRGSARFKSAIELGFDKALVREISESLLRLGPDSKFRFITFSARPTDKPNVSESRLAPALINRARAEARKLGVTCVYFPKSLRQDALLIDDAGAKWLRKAGFAVRTIVDVYGVSSTVLYRVIGKTPPGHPVEQVRSTDTKRDAFKTGLKWLLGRVLPSQGPGAKPYTSQELLQVVGPGRIIRCGAAVQAFREALKRDPLRPSQGKTRRKKSTAKAA